MAVEASFNEAPEETVPVPRGEASYDFELRRIAAFLVGSAADTAAVPWGELRQQDLLTIRTWALEALGFVAARRTLAALRAAVRQSQAWPNRFDASGIDLLRTRHRSTGAIGRRLTVREIGSLFDACQEDERTAGWRDAALIVLLVCAGLRPASIVHLKVGDYDNEAQTLATRNAGGRGVTKAIAFDEFSGQVIGEWLSVRGGGAGPLFLAVDREGRVREGTGIGRSAINAILGQRARQACIASLRPRDLRATFLAGLRDQTRQNPFAPPARFALGDDGQACLVVPAISMAALRRSSRHGESPLETGQALAAADPM
jgi:integrase/recombinase XerD